MNVIVSNKNILEKQIKGIAQKLVKDLTSYDEMETLRNFNSVVYTKSSPNVIVSKKIDDNVGTVSISGEDAKFIEFGSGVYYNGQAGSSPHQWANRTEPPSLIGTYGGGRGKKRGWVYFSNDAGNEPNTFTKLLSTGQVMVVTHGVQAQYPIYNAYKSMKQYSKDKYGCKEK